jgi:P27 family predicted phage terminase small subunit
MARTGRPPKPTALKRLKGTYRKDRQRGREWQPPAGAPAMPKSLDARAREVWRECVALLLPPGILTIADGEALADYCRAVSRADAADAVVADEGLTTATAEGIKVHPAVTIAQRERSAAARLRTLFGLDPSSRAKLNVPEAPKTDEAADFLFRPPLKVVK